MAYYKNGDVETLSKEYVTRPLEVITIPFSDSLEIFSYSVEHGGLPDKVERIVYASNGNSYKWIIYRRAS